MFYTSLHYIKKKRILNCVGHQSRDGAKAVLFLYPYFTLDSLGIMDIIHMN